jgi:hypothetical protein
MEIKYVQRGLNLIMKISSSEENISSETDFDAVKMNKFVAKLVLNFASASKYNVLYMEITK